MNRIKIIVGIFLFCPIFSINADAQELAFGKYSPADFAYSEVPFQPEAAAVVLGEFSVNTVNLEGVASEVLRRIKILKPEGTEAADIVIRYYAPSVRISDIKAQTVNMQDGGPVITKVKETDIYTVDGNNGYKEIRFAFPDAKVGSILEYEYTSSDTRLTILQPWVFQNPYPTLVSVYSMEIGGSLNYRALSQGPQATKFQFGGRKDGIYKWTLTNLRAIEEEPYMSYYEDYLERVEFQLSGYGFRGSNNVFVDWNDLAEFILALDQFKSYIKPNKNAAEILAKAQPTGSTQLEKAKSLFDHVVNNYEYNRYIGIIPDKTLKEVLAEKSGSRASINNLLMAYLLHHGIEAYPILISSKGSGRSKIIDSPFADQFNNLILVVKADEKFYYVDATSKLVPFGYLPVDFHISKGFLMREDASGLTPINLTHRSGVNQTTNIKYDGSDILKIDATIRFLDYDAINAAMIAADMEEGEIIEKYFQNEGESVKEFGFSSKDEPRKTYDVKLTKTLDGFGGELLLITPFQYTRWDESPFKSEKRTFPIDFDHTFTDNFNAVIEVPEGYVVDDYPAAVSMGLSSNQMVFNYKIEVLDAMVKINANLELKTGIFQPESYAELKQMFETITSKLQEPVVLKKVANP
jgi:hypothetical protein